MLLSSFIRSILPPKKSIVQPKQPPVPDGRDKDRMVKHPFDGDGAVLGVTFSGDGKAVARFRYVRTIAFIKERKKGLKLYNGMESTRLHGATVGNGQGNDFPIPMFKHHLKPGLNKSRKNTSNTRAVYWSKKLLTLWEGGLPYKIDCLGLTTEGRSQLGGVLLEATPFGGRAVYDSFKDRMLFYANEQDSGSSMLTLYEFNSDFRLVNKQTQKLPGFALISDFGVTENYAIFVQPPVSTNAIQFLINRDPGKSLNVEGGASNLYVMSRFGDQSLKSISIPSDGISDADLLYCNAYEDEGGKSVVFDVIRSDGKNASCEIKDWPWFLSLKDFQESSSKKSLWRYKVDLSSNSVSKDCLSTMQTSFGVINPSFSGKRHRFVYSVVGAMGSEVAPPQGIAKFDTDLKTSEVWFPREYEFCGEPFYAPKKGQINSSVEDSGYILSVLNNGRSKQSEMVVFEAKSIKNGPIARIPLGIGIPHGLHGCFTASEEACWPEDEIQRRAKLADKMESKGNRWNEVKSDFSGLGLRLDDFEEYFGDIL